MIRPDALNRSAIDNALENFRSIRLELLDKFGIHRGLPTEIGSDAIMHKAVNFA